MPLCVIDLNLRSNLIDSSEVLTLGLFAGEVAVSSKASSGSKASLAFLLMMQLGDDLLLNPRTCSLQIFLKFLLIEEAASEAMEFSYPEEKDKLCC